MLDRQAHLKHQQKRCGRDQCLHKSLNSRCFLIEAAGFDLPPTRIDMALHLASEIAGVEFAQMVQLGIEYDPQPPFDTGSPKTTPAPLVELVRAAMAQPDPI